MATASFDLVAAWKRILIGSAAVRQPNLQDRLRRNGVRICTWAQEMLSHPLFGEQCGKGSVNLVRLTVGQLGFPSGASLYKVYDRAAEFGLTLCPAGVVTCSPKTDPGVMRVNCPKTGQEILSETQEAFPRADRPQAA